MGEGSQMPEPLALPTEFSPSALLGSIRAQETISKPCVYVHFLMFGASSSQTTIIQKGLGIIALVSDCQDLAVPPHQPGPMSLPL